MLQQIAQEGEGLWPQRNLLGSIPELGIGWIEAKRREEKDVLLFHRGTAWESLRKRKKRLSGRLKTYYACESSFAQCLEIPVYFHVHSGFSSMRALLLLRSQRGSS